MARVETDYNMVKLENCLVLQVLSLELSKTCSKLLDSL